MDDKEQRESSSSIELRLLGEKDIPRVAEIYAVSFLRANVGEEWTPDKAEEFIRYWFHRQPDLFFVAVDNEKVVGGFVAAIKPWWNGNHLVDGEIFVDPDYQSKGIVKSLLKEGIEKARDKYNAVEMEGIADGKNNFPMPWYKKLGLQESRWKFISGEIEVILKNL